jgi:hypothetical protein
VLRILGPKRDKLKGEWRKLHNEELRGLCSSPECYQGHQIKDDGMGGTCSTHGPDEKRIQNLGRFSSLGFEPGANNSSQKKKSVLQNVTQGLRIGRSFWIRIGSAGGIL